MTSAATAAVQMIVEKPYCCAMIEKTRSTRTSSSAPPRMSFSAWLMEASIVASGDGALGTTGPAELACAAVGGAGTGARAALESGTGSTAGAGGGGGTARPGGRGCVSLSVISGLLVE